MFYYWLILANKWGQSSSSRYPENQPKMIYGMDYDQINPSRSDPGYLVLDLKKLAQGYLKFHKHPLNGQRQKPNKKSSPNFQQQQQENRLYRNFGQYYNNNNNNYIGYPTYYPFHQQPYYQQNIQ